MHGVLHHAGKAFGDGLGFAQVGFGEHHEQGSVVLQGGEVHPAHQAAEDARGIEIRVAPRRRSKENRATVRPLPRDCGLINGSGEVAVEGGTGQ